MADPVRDFLADDDGDLAVVNGDFAFAIGKDAVPQGIDCRLKTFLGEIWLDETQGVPYLEDILVKNPDVAVVQEDLREAIANTPDVTDVVSTDFELDVASRAATTSFQAVTVYSTDTLTGETKVQA